MKHYLSEAACLAAALMVAASPAYAIMKTKECAAIGVQRQGAFKGRHENPAVPLPGDERAGR